MCFNNSEKNMRRVQRIALKKQTAENNLRIFRRGLNAAQNIKLDQRVQLFEMNLQQMFEDALFPTHHGDFIYDSWQTKNNQYMPTVFHQLMEIINMDLN